MTSYQYTQHSFFDTAQTYSALQSKMKAAMAAADRATLAVDGLLQLQLQKQRRTAAVAASGGQSFGDDGAGGGVDEDEDGDDLSQVARSQKTVLCVFLFIFFAVSYLGNTLQSDQ